MTATPRKTSDNTQIKAEDTLMEDADGLGAAGNDEMQFGESVPYLTV